MSLGKVKHLFPGGNTSLGFFSYYGSIISQEEAKRLIVIKGGPGVGKSSFMKKIGEDMLQKGYDAEFLHCSSDNNSLDGIKIPELKIALIDGTSPHVVDPRSPGAVDEILNFGEFWDEKGIRVHKYEIIETNKEIGRIFARAYKYLKGALCIYEDNAAINALALRKGEVNLLVDKLTEEIFSGIKTSAEEGIERSLFASAITPDGYCNYLDSILTCGRVYEFIGGLATVEGSILERIKSSAIKRGFFVESYYCAFTPSKLEHLVIPKLDVALTTSNKYHSSGIIKFKSIDISRYYDQNILQQHTKELEQNQAEFDNMMSIAFSTINSAKALHDKLETYYIPNIDFKAIDECFKKTICKILAV